MTKKLDILSVDCDWIISLKQQEELLNFVIPLLYTHDNVITSLVHDTIYPIFEHGYDEYNLINIDHHHDFSYNNELDNKLNEGNWLFHLSNIFKKKINYLWINNPNSHHVLINRLDNLKSYYFDHNLSYIKNKKFDKIFICCSPDYALAAEAIIAFKILERIVNENKKSRP
tara:strand:+ start:559 stop:1071 length:513 start_codon:yes stop_codon:yes gene_type:complete